MKVIVFSFSLLFFFTQCDEAKSQLPSDQQLLSQKYWSDGLAEVSKYDLQQNRYDNIHEGHLIQVFVSEDFLTDKQVKNELYKSNKSTKILKRIETRHFTTGIYDYNMFSSSFTPFDTKKFPKSLKVTSTSQEWCGTTFTQLNLTKKGYQHTINSYFETEGDNQSIIKDAIAEEDIFTKIRMNPSLLPIGKFDFIPSGITSRLLHLKAKSYKSKGQMQDYTGNDFIGNSLKSYVIQTPSIERTVEIVFENKPPYKIVGWTDTYPSVFDKKPRKTVAKLTHQIKEAYWGLNGKNDTEIRSRLGLE